MQSAWRIPSVNQQQFPLGRVRERTRRRIQDTQESRNLQISLQNDRLFTDPASASLCEACPGALLDGLDKGREVVVGVSESLGLAHGGERALRALEGHRR